jgi:hypothetical protein
MADVVPAFRGLSYAGLGFVGAAVDADAQVTS